MNILLLSIPKKVSPTGNRTLVSRVTGGDTHHYTIEDIWWRWLNWSNGNHHRLDIQNSGLNRDSNPGPLAPKARIIPLDHWAAYEVASHEIAILNALLYTPLKSSILLEPFVYSLELSLSYLSRVAQRKRAGPITQRSVDRNHPLLHTNFHLFIIYSVKNVIWSSTFIHSSVLDSIVVSIPACHAGDQGSIPCRGDLFINLFVW